MKIETKKNSLWAIMSGIISLMVSGAIGVIIPIILDINNYSSYQTYQLYISFVGLLHFGFINGVCLKYGNKDYDELPFSIFRGYIRYLFLLQMVVLIIAFFILLFFVKTEEKTPFIFLFINSSLINISCYFSLITQFTKRFIIDGKIQIILSGLLLLLFSIIMTYKINNYEYYLCCITIVNITSLMLYLAPNIKTVVGRWELSFSDIIECHKRGVYINFSEIIGIVIVSIDSVFVNVLCDEEVFAIYTFSAGIVLLYYKFVNIISKLFFPYLKRVNKEELAASYTKLTERIQCIIFLMLSSIGLFGEIVNYLNHEYSESLMYVTILLPTVVFKCLIDLLCNTIYKVMDLEKAFFKNNMFAVCIVIITNIFAWRMFQKAYAIAWASLFSYILWYFITDFNIRKLLNISELKIKNKILLLGCTFIFLISMLFFGDIWLYLSVAIVYTFFSMRRK